MQSLFYCNYCVIVVNNKLLTMAIQLIDFLID